MEKNEKKLKVEKILELSLAVDIIAENDRLPGTVAYWLGRLSDFCSGPIKNYRKLTEKALADIKPEQDELIAEAKKLTPEKDKERLDEITARMNVINNKFNEDNQKLLEEEDVINMPVFKLKDFIADADGVYTETITELDEEGKQKKKKVEIAYKKGQSLVPVRFFKLMGEFVTE